MQRETHRPCSSREERHLGYYDVHARHAIDFSEVLKFQAYVNPTDIVLGGDFLDCSVASHWNERFFKYIGWSKISSLLKAEFKCARALIRRIRERSPRANIWMIPGNHENWLFLSKFHYPEIEAIPALPERFYKPNFRTDFERMGQKALANLLENALDTASYDVKVLPYRQILTLGKISYLHGDQFTSVRSSAKLFPTRNLVFGHFHTHDVNTLNDNGREGTAVQHVCVPCMTHLGPGYLQSGSTRWLKGFWMARVRPGGLFDGNVVKILGGKHIVY